jgi:hypothetical protein
VVEGVAGGFVVAAEEVDVEDVFPGTSAHGAGFDLAEADVTQGENAQRLEERSGNILDFEGDRSLVGAARDEALAACRGGCRLANEEEAGEVAFVVFNASLKDFAGVFASGMASGDAGGIEKAMGDDMLHASGRIVERDWLYPGMVAEEVAALVEGDRVGEQLADRAQLYAGGGDYIMHDAQPELGLDENIPRDQKIGMLGDGAGERVLDGDDRGGDRSALHAVKYFDGAGAGDDRAAGQHALGSFVAEGSEFALNGNFHHWQGSWSVGASASPRQTSAKTFNRKVR